MKKVFGILPFLILGFSGYITFSNSWLAPDINRWQAGMMGDNKYFPALTMFILALPPLLVLAAVKWWLHRKSAK